MMIIRTVLIICVASMCCGAQVSRESRLSKCNPFIYERLRSYFEVNELRATQVVNLDPDPGTWESRTQTIIIGGQKIEWIDDVNKQAYSASVRINGELISLADKTSLNSPDEKEKLELGVIGQWTQIKLYKIGDQTLIGISMRPRSCTGLMCGVGAQLWYDVKSRKQTFFETYRTDPDVRLFQWTKENTIYAISTNFQGDPHGTVGSSTVTYTMYRLGSDGRFQLQKDARGIAYFIKHTSYPDTELKGATPRRKRERTPDSLEQHWIEDVLGSAQ